MRFENKVYDVLKWIATLLLPALGTLYFTLASIWGLPCSEQVVGTIMAVDALLGVLLGISSAGYKGDGTLMIDPGGFDEGDEFECWLDIPHTFEELKKKKLVTLEVGSVEDADGQG